ncbi:TNF receptor-associated factor 6 [Pseudolycoriella hygida]|uniref:TNF receptor-associated factor 6 n=1 Tax=Pseudolycoriella hygida TaxID=35572 RepID=A0A9Q0S5Y4_9DIPT|nr:TNF receptor-associated factor 6 [Pseudolycoriella hygida]
MAKSMSRRVSAQEATIMVDVKTDEPSQHESRFECPICIYWLNEPVLTSCGHRFCKKCIISWLKNKNNCCPIDNKPLTENDLFPDNFTRREIQNMRKLCPNSSHGCQISTSPLEMDSHLLECSFRERVTVECSFRQCGCTFKANTQSEIDAHVQDDMVSHLNLLMTAFKQNISFEFKSIEENKLWDAPNKNTNGTEDLLKVLYERIVVLEQQNREKDAQIEKLTKDMTKVCLVSEIEARYSGGVLVWQITQFNSKVQAMRSDPNKMYYSNETFTSPHGYRYCARINISPKRKDFIGLHIHLMRSDNDFHLDWPFRGRIKISMIHRNLNETKHETIMSKPDILAFHRPTQKISPRGFGFIDYANIDELVDKGFIMMDTLSLKIELNIV